MFEKKKSQYSHLTESRGKLLYRSSLEETK